MAVYKPGDPGRIRGFYATPVFIVFMSFLRLFWEGCAWKTALFGARNDSTDKGGLLRDKQGRKKYASSLRRMVAYGGRSKKRH